ncbi:hypothetical protein [Bradyrhizobium sp. NAS96.2]|uniref:hypothetical protein n=1 Tax=Bradyrhizobium sp. NAS96.2 TaxID=1680160 RepID=UPI000AA85BE4|nr:hypothetical protein [Bradyrhizobium sp. NAS96.2]
MNKKRLGLLRKLESIIGNECYNGSTQNWGPGGRFEGEGREFRYPLTVLGEDGSKIKVKSDRPLSLDVAMTGYYAFGANQLHIMRALEQVLSYLEANNQLKI